MWQLQCGNFYFLNYFLYQFTTYIIQIIKISLNLNFPSIISLNAIEIGEIGQTYFKPFDTEYKDPISHG